MMPSHPILVNDPFPRTPPLNIATRRQHLWKVVNNFSTFFHHDR